MTSYIRVTDKAALRPPQRENKILDDEMRYYGERSGVDAREVLKRLPEDVWRQRPCIVMKCPECDIVQVVPPEVYDIYMLDGSPAAKMLYAASCSECGAFFTASNVDVEVINAMAGMPTYTGTTVAAAVYLSQKK